MLARRLSTGAVWDLSPAYLERYKNDFEILPEEPKDTVEEREVEVVKPLPNKRGRPKKEVAKR